MNELVISVLAKLIELSFFYNEKLQDYFYSAMNSDVMLNSIMAEIIFFNVCIKNSEWRLRQRWLNAAKMNYFVLI
jgi:hypothetical protein